MSTTLYSYLASLEGLQPGAQRVMRSTPTRVPSGMYAIVTEDSDTPHTAFYGTADVAKRMLSVSLYAPEGTDLEAFTLLYNQVQAAPRYVNAHPYANCISPLERFDALAPQEDPQTRGLWATVRLLMWHYRT